MFVCVAKLSPLAASLERESDARSKMSGDVTAFKGRLYSNNSGNLRVGFRRHDFDRVILFIMS